MNNDDRLDKILRLMTSHVFQLEVDSTKTDKEGQVRGYTPADSQVLERYAKILLAIAKKPGDSDPTDDMTDEQLEDILKGTDNVDDTTSPDE